MSNGEIIFKKDIEKVVTLQVKDLMQIIAKLRAKKVVCTFLSHTKHHFHCTKYHAPKTMLCSNTLKRNKLKVYFSLEDNKLVTFANSETHYILGS